jgi:hypothetical protein
MRSRKSDQNFPPFFLKEFSSRAENFRQTRKASKAQSFTRSHQCLKQFCVGFSSSKKHTHKSGNLFGTCVPPPHPAQHIYQRMLDRDFQTTHFSELYSRREQVGEVLEIQIQINWGFFSSVA